MKNLFYPAKFLESKDKEGKEWEVVLIQSGKSLNDKVYSPEVLKKSVSLFENVKAFAYEFQGKIWNHLPNLVRKVIPEGCIKNIVGWYDNIRYASFQDEDGRTQEGILARLHIPESASWLRNLLKEAWDYGKKSLLGFSIDGDGEIEEKFQNGKKVFDVKKINRIDEVTLVTNPAAGGQFVRLLASKNLEGENQMNWLKDLYEKIKVLKEELLEGIDPENITLEQEISLIKHLVESPDFPGKVKEAGPFISATFDRLISLLKGDKKDEALKLLEDLKGKMEKYAYPEVAKYYGYSYGAGKYPEPKESEKKIEEEKQMEEINKVKEDILKTKAEIEKIKEETEKMKVDTEKSKSQALLEEILSKSDLFEPIKAKIREQFKDKVFVKEDIEKVIQSEKDVLAKLSESGNIKGLGQTKIEVMKDQLDKQQKAMDLLIDPELKGTEGYKELGKGFTSLKESYRSINPEDGNISGQVDPNRQHKRLTEDITSADFTYILGTSMTRKMQRLYKIAPFRFDPIVTKVSVDNFKQQERVKWGGYSGLPSITEDAAYTDLYEPKDEEATYTAGTKGGYVSVSRKTIKNDDLGYIRQIPKLMAQAGKWQLENDIAGVLLTGTTAANYTPDVDALFSAAKGNYSTNALSYANLTTAKNKIANQKMRGNAQDSGTATAGAATTITDSGKSWTTNAFATYYVRIVYGTGSGQTRVIASNTGTVITISAAWTTNPDTTSKYEVSSMTLDDQVIGLQAKYILFGTEKNGVVTQLLKSEYDPDTSSKYIYNIHQGTLEPIWVPQITGATYQYYWYLACDKNQIDMIEVGFVDGQEEPLLVIQDQPYAGQVFTNDRIRWKVRYEYGYTATEYKGLYGAFATS